MLGSLFALSFFEELYTPLLGNTGINLIFLIIFIVFVGAAFTDFLDGYLARKNHQVTNLGKFLDPVADKLLINSLIIFLIAPSLVARYNVEQTVSFNLWCAILIIARDIIIDALRFIAARKGTVIAANIFGKLKTVLEMIAICAVLLNDFPFSYFDMGWPAGLRISDILVYLATAVSVVSGVIYVWQNKHVFKEDENDRK